MLAPYWSFFMDRLCGMFEGWYTDGEKGLLFDTEGNHYYIHEIRAIFYYRELAKEFEGSPADIQSLKRQLKEKIDKVTLPTVTVDWGDIQERYIHPHYRK